jgi:1-acyl-sn-glycerol-3-phosphate acyltransferase
MRVMVQVYLVGLFRLVNRERMPLEGGVLVCSNHASTVDPPLLPVFLPRSDSWSMAKSEYFDRPFTRWFFTRYHAFPVVRHTADRSALRRSFDILNGGAVLVIYPEGTRYDTWAGEQGVPADARVAGGELRVAEPGAGFVARATGTVVQPVALLGTRACFPQGARWPHRVPVEIRFGRPIRIRERRPDGRKVDNQEAVDAIMLAIAEDLPESMRGAYADLPALRGRLEGVTEPA